MSFDRYFEDQRSSPSRDANNDDWYQIVEEALYAADLASSRHRQQLEKSMMKALPPIPENDADSVRRHSLATRPVTIIEIPTASEKDSQSKDEFARVAGQRYHRRSSSVYSIDYDSPLSPENDDLDTWAKGVCHTRENTMSSLRSKPYSRPSSYTSSSVSGKSTSAGSSIMLHGRSRSTSSSVYSADTSVDSYGSSAKSVCMHSRNVSATSEAPSKHQMQVEVDSVASESFFDFSDHEEEEQEEVTVARAESSASNYVKHLRKKALSLRIATSRKSQARVQTMSVEAPALSTWLFRSSALGRRTSTVSVGASTCGDELALENELMAGAANSAKARRLLGLSNR